MYERDKERERERERERNCSLRRLQARGRSSMLAPGFVRERERERVTEAERGERGR